MRDLDSELWSLGLTAGEYVKFDGTKFVGDTPSSSNIGNSNLTSTDATRRFVLFGDTSSDKLSFLNGSGSVELMSIKGDGSHELITDNATEGVKVYRDKLVTPNNWIALQPVSANGAEILLNAKHGGANYAGINLDANSGSYIRSANWVLFGQNFFPFASVFRINMTNEEIDFYGNERLQGAGTHKRILGGALSTDNFTIRNSADTKSLFKVDGDGDVQFQLDNTNGFYEFKDSNGTTRVTYQLTTNEAVMSLTSAGGINQLRSQVNTSQWMQNWWGGNLGLGFTVTKPTGSELNVFGIKNGTAPSSSYTDATQIYSADESAGNACPHFRTENGSIIKLYKEAALTASDGTLANAVTRIGEIETVLQNFGLLT